MQSNVAEASVDAALCFPFSVMRCSMKIYDDLVLRFSVIIKLSKYSTIVMCGVFLNFRRQKSFLSYGVDLEFCYFDRKSENE